VKRQGIGYVPEDRHLHGVVEDLPVVDNIAVMRAGKMVKVLERGEATQERILEYAMEASARMRAQ
jgi:ABC-type sugar transport system ATPase subunit